VPVVLSQLYSPGERVYEDVEYSLYHYPAVYFKRVQAYDTFIYYRPRGKRAARLDANCYFGHGVLGKPFDDPRDRRARFVPLIKAEPFKALVPIKDFSGGYYETESGESPMFISAVRTLSQTAYYRILALGGVALQGISMMPSTELVAAAGYDYSQLTAVPKDELRAIDVIPPGAGYVPRGDTRVNVFESAALQERARKDHQLVLETIRKQVQKLGGSTFYNNNIDLFACVGNGRYLIEAKSLQEDGNAVGRMRYGIGQLADYGYRYEKEIGHAQRVLAFGTQPNAGDAWISNVLERENIAFVSTLGEHVVALNDMARSLPFLTP
jgi:hypothetical protein